MTKELIHTVNIIHSIVLCLSHEVPQENMKTETKIVLFLYTQFKIYQNMNKYIAL